MGAEGQTAVAQVLVQYWPNDELSPLTCRECLDLRAYAVALMHRTFFRTFSEQMSASVHMNIQFGGKICVVCLIYSHVEKMWKMMDHDIQNQMQN